MYQINNKFEIGEECWTYTMRNAETDCPVCKGTKELMFSGYSIPCKQCNKTGKIYLKIQAKVPAKVKIGFIRASVHQNNIEIKYRVHPVDMFDNIRNRAESYLFKTEEEAAEWCKQENMK